MSSTPDPLDLTSLEDTYEILGELSGRDDARVFMGKRRADRIDVTILLAEAAKGRSPGALTHLAADARLLAGCTHPNLVPVFEGRWIGTSAVAVVTGRIAGPTLWESLARGEALSLQRIAEILHEINGLLTWAREQKVVNRGVTAKSVIVEHGTGRIHASFAVHMAADSGLPGTARDASTIAALAWTMLTRTALPPAGSKTSLAELRPDLPTRVVEETETLLQLPAEGDTRTDVLGYIARIALSETLMVGQTDAAQLRAELAEERAAAERAVAAERAESERFVASERARIAQERAEHERCMAEERTLLASERAEQDRLFAAERAEIDRAAAAERAQLALERETQGARLAAERATHVAAIEAERTTARAQLSTERQELERFRVDEQGRLAADRAEFEADRREAERNWAEAQRQLAGERLDGPDRRTVLPPSLAPAPAAVNGSNRASLALIGAIIIIIGVVVVSALGVGRRAPTLARGSAAASAVAPDPSIVRDSGTTAFFDSAGGDVAGGTHPRVAPFPLGTTFADSQPLSGRPSLPDSAIRKPRLDTLPKPDTLVKPDAIQGARR